MKGKQLDFIVIGAQKSATTTVYKYLNEHDRIMLPEDKEAPFFNLPSLDTTQNDYAAFLEEHFVHQDPSAQGIWGKVSPQYMSSNQIPQRIKQANPNVKIIAILRHPIKRAFSHYRMAVRRGTETRTFGEAMSESIKYVDKGRSGFAPTHQNGYESEADFYAAWGEYGRVLERYYQVFNAQNILVIFAEDLAENPTESLDQILSFIGLEPNSENPWRPDSLGKKFHQGGAKPWINPMRLKAAVKAPLLNQIYRRVPEAFKNKLRYWVDQLNVRKDTANQIQQESELSASVMDELSQLYREDAAILIGLGHCPPWKM